MIPKDLLESLKKQNEIVVKEVIEQNEYGIDPKNIENHNVLDIGANIGCFSILAASLGAKLILSFEPNHDNFMALCSNAKQFPSIHPLRFAVGSGLSETCGLSGIGAMCEVSNSGGKVPMVSLAQAMALLSPTDNNLVLKMDIEGSEFDALYYAGGSVLRRFQTVFIEMHCKEKVKKLNFHLTAADTMKNFMEFCGFKQTLSKPMFWFISDHTGKTVSCTPCLEVAKFERI